MGASSSIEQVSSEQREVEALAASTGALLMLQRSFSNLVDPQTSFIPVKTLQQCFSLIFSSSICKSHQVPALFPKLSDHLGPSIVDLYFTAEKGGISWIEFLRGYIKCGRMNASVSLGNLLRVFISAASNAGISLDIQLEFNDDNDDYKLSGSLLATDVFVFLWMCWFMSLNSKLLKFPEASLGDVDHLVLSAVTSCAENGSELDVWDCDSLSLDIKLHAGKFHAWVLTTVPGLVDCFTLFIHASLQKYAALKDKSEASGSLEPNTLPKERCCTYILTHGRAWAISLSTRSTITDEIIRARFSSDDGINEGLLYRSCIHGRGLNRFWSNVEGYNGPLLILVLGSSSGDADNSSASGRRWIIGALTQQGFENRDKFYGSSGNLYAISPVFHSYSPSGKEKNFVYSHLHSTGGYEPHPKPAGIGFGGSISNERVFIDEDFSKVMVRHHATDKTYKPGSLIPNQGFLPVEACVLEIEVWGLGGGKAKEMQMSYKKREELFTEQRRKVDMKTFAKWDDSPEKMTMDMMADSHTVQREDR